MRAFPQSGDYRVDQPFRIAAGAWYISFAKGDKLRFDYTTKRMLKLNPKTKTWNNISPPIQGEYNFSLPLYHGGNKLKELFIACDHDEVHELTLEEVQELLGFRVRIV